MFPYKTETFFIELDGIQDVTFFDNEEITILGIAMQQSNNSSDTEVGCGSQVLAKNYATNFSQVLMQHECFDGIRLSKTGQDSSSINVVFARGYLDEATTTYNYIYNPTKNDDIATTTDLTLYGSFTAGEVVIALFLFFLICIELLKSIIASLNKIGTGKTYLQYNGGDVEIRKDL